MQRRRKLNAEKVLQRISLNTTLIHRPTKIVDKLIESIQTEEKYANTLKDIYVNISNFCRDSHLRHNILMSIESVIPKYEIELWKRLYLKD